MNTPATFLGLNESPYAPCDPVVQAAQQACLQANRYPEWDSSELRTALAQHWDVTKDWVIAAGGSAAIIQQTMIASGQGDIVFGWPGFDAFPAIAKGLRMPVHTVALRDDGSCDLDKMLQTITPKTTMVIVCTPNAPIGGIVHHNQLADFLQAVPDTITVLIDEAYAAYVQHKQAVRALEFVRAHPNVVMSRTFSKSHSMAGFRVGYAIAQPALAERIRAAGIPFSVPLPAQAAALAALAHEAESSSRIQAILVERDRLATMLRRLGNEVVVGHGNFVWLPVGELAQHVADALKAHGVIVRALAPFGVRVSVGTSEDTDRLETAWQQANPLQQM